MEGRLNIMKFVKKLCVLVFASLMVISFSACGEKDTNNDTADNSETVSQEVTNDFTTDYTATAYATIDVKDYGKIKVALDGNAAPITVANFIKLAESKFYDGLTFHRIMSGFVIQGGDPNGNGTGGSEETIKGEFKQNGVENKLSHIRGAISMARNSFDLNSATSQFFIVHNDSAIPSLDGMYACFGYVEDGMEVVDKICEDAKPTDTNGTIPAGEQPIINSVTITYP